MKKLMILGAGVYQYPLVEYASRHYSVILAAPEVSEPFRKLVSKIFILDLRQKEKILQIAREEKVDGIITDQTDIPVRTVAYAAEKLHLPGIGYETACLFTDKNKMRERLEELKLPVLPRICTDSLDKALAFSKAHPYPQIIKPTDNQGSRGVFKIESEEDLRRRFEEAKQHSSAGMVILEKFVEGTEAVVESITFDYQYKNLICGDTIYFSSMKNVFAAKQRVFPSSLPEEAQKKILELDKKIITGFKLKQGISHSEYIIDKDRQVYLIETAARGGGVFISSDLISLSTGLNVEQFLTGIAVGDISEFPEFEQCKCACCYIAFYLPPGEIVEIQGVETVKTFPFVHHHLLDTLHVGKKMGSIADKTTRFSIIVSGRDHIDLHANIAKIKKTLNIKVKNKDKDLGIIWE